MSRLLRIAAREYLSYVRTVGFWLSLLLAPVALTAAAVAPYLVMMDRRAAAPAGHHRPDRRGDRPGADRHGPDPGAAGAAAAGDRGAAPPQVQAAKTARAAGAVRAR